MPLNIKELRAKSGFTQAELADEIGVTRQTIINWEKGQSDPDKEELDRLAAALNVEVSMITLSVDRSNSDAEKIPFYDAVAVGGLSVLADQTPVIEPTEMIDPGTWFRTASGALRVYGHSMFPKYPAGCIVAFKKSSKDIPAVIVWGEDYVIELEDRRILKRVDRGETKASIKAVSYNVNKDNKYVYDPIEIPLSDVKRMYMVLGKVELEASI